MSMPTEIADILDKFKLTIPPLDSQPMVDQLDPQRPAENVFVDFFIQNATAIYNQYLPQTYSIEKVQKAHQEKPQDFPDIDFDALSGEVLEKYKAFYCAFTCSHIRWQLCSYIWHSLDSFYYRYDFDIHYIRDHLIAYSRFMVDQFQYELFRTTHEHLPIPPDEKRHARRPPLEHIHTLDLRANGVTLTPVSILHFTHVSTLRIKEPTLALLENLPTLKNLSRLEIHSDRITELPP